MTWERSEKYNKQTRQGGLFTNYINCFLKIKQQASGFPDSILSEEDKTKYIQDYFNSEGIHLEREKISRNPGLRNLAKLCLNSFYGKLAQRVDLKKTKFISDLAELLEVFDDVSHKVNDFSFLTDNIVQVDLTPIKDFGEQMPNSNVPLAAFCTSYARLSLLKVMRQLGERVLYHDTDSVIFTSQPGDYVPPVGRYLGELTNELTCKDVHCTREECGGAHSIRSFVSCGAKNYAFEIDNGHVVCKVRGFSLNHNNSKIVNKQSMEQALDSWIKNDPVPPLVTVSCEIRRDPKRVQIVNKQVSKQYGVVFDKRIARPDFSTVPFGFRPPN